MLWLPPQVLYLGNTMSSGLFPTLWECSICSFVPLSSLLHCNWWFRASHPMSIFRISALPRFHRGKCISSISSQWGPSDKLCYFCKIKQKTFLWLILTGLVFSFLEEFCVICKCGKCTMRSFLHGTCKVTNKDKFHCLFLCDSSSDRFHTQAMFITYFWSTIKSISGTPCIWCSLLSE